MISTARAVPGTGIRLRFSLVPPRRRLVGRAEADHLSRDDLVVVVPQPRVLTDEEVKDPQVVKPLLVSAGLRPELVSGLSLSPTQPSLAGPARSLYGARPLSAVHVVEVSREWRTGKGDYFIHIFSSLRAARPQGAPAGARQLPAQGLRLTDVVWLGFRGSVALAAVHEAGEAPMVDEGDEAATAVQGQRAGREHQPWRSECRSRRTSWWYGGWCAGRCRARFAIGPSHRGESAGTALSRRSIGRPASSLASHSRIQPLGLPPCACTDSRLSS